jgi:hypothetical protein
MGTRAAWPAAMSVRAAGRDVFGRLMSGTEAEEVDLVLAVAVAVAVAGSESRVGGAIRSRGLSVSRTKGMGARGQAWVVPTSFDPEAEMLVLRNSCSPNSVRPGSCGHMVRMVRPSRRETTTAKGEEEWKSNSTVQDVRLVPGGL